MLSEKLAAHASPTQLSPLIAPRRSMRPASQGQLLSFTHADSVFDAQSDNADATDEPKSKPVSETNPTVTASIGDPAAPSGPAVDGSPGFDVSALQLPERRPNEIARTQLQNAFSNLRLLKEQQRLWTLAAKAKHKEAFEAYLRAFPRGIYASLAKRRLAALKAAAQANAAEQERKRKAAAEAAAKPVGPRTGNVALAEQPKPPVALAPSGELREQSPRVRWPSSDEPFADRLPGSIR